MSKILITSGCSFSECISTHIDTWPRHIYRRLQKHDFYKHISSAMASQGNGLISRGIIYNVAKALKEYKPEDILVGVMWSGSNRHDFRCRSVEDLNFVQNKIHNNWLENPTKFVHEADKNWVILNVHWASNNFEAKTYYQMYHDDIGSSIYSLEHIIRTQDFLQKNNIKYFFTDYVNENIVPDALRTHPEIEYLLELVDKKNYLPVISEFDWCIKNTKFSNLWRDPEHKYWEHPHTLHHKEFAELVIFKYLKDKNYI